MERLKDVEHSMLGMKSALYDEINSVRNDRTQENVSKAKVISQLSHRLVEAEKLQFKIDKMNKDMA